MPAFAGKRGKCAETAAKTSGQQQPALIGERLIQLEPREQTQYETGQSVGRKGRPGKARLPGLDGGANGKPTETAKTAAGKNKYVSEQIGHGKKKPRLIAARATTKKLSYENKNFFSRTIFVLQE